MFRKAKQYICATGTFSLLFSLFTLNLIIFPPVAQLDNAADSDSEEWGFKSLRVGQKKRLVSTSRFFNEIRLAASEILLRNMK